MELATTTDQLQLCTFHVGPLFLGIDVKVVQEVIRYQEMTSVPLARPGVEGLINLRGQIVTAIDMRTQLDLEPAEDGRLPMNVVIRTEDLMASLLVDEIGDVVDIDPAQIEPPPATLPAQARKFVQAVYKMENQLLLLLDPLQAVCIDGSDENNGRDESSSTPD